MQKWFCHRISLYSDRIFTWQFNNLRKLDRCGFMVSGPRNWDFIRGTLWSVTNLTIIIHSSMTPFTMLYFTSLMKRWCLFFSLWVWATLVTYFVQHVHQRCWCAGFMPRLQGDCHAFPLSVLGSLLLPWYSSHRLALWKMKNHRNQSPVRLAVSTEAPSDV